MGEAGNKKKVMKKLIITLCCIVGVLLILAGVAAVWINSLLGRIGSLDNSPTLSPEQLESLLAQTDALDPDYTGPVYNAGDITLPTIPADIIVPSENVINILLVGQDRREGQPRLHSDAMILCTINKAKKTLTMTSFMRDMWVPIPGYGEQRINTTYMIDGFDLLNKTLEHNFGVSADYNVEIDFSGFMTTVDLVGGVDVELTKQEAEYLNRRGNWDIEENMGWTLTEGMNHLTGSQALAYSRIRDIGDDFARTGRQRTVLMALIDAATKMPSTELYGLVQTLLPLFSTDMSKGQILGLAVDMLPMITELELVSQRIPMDGQFSYAKIEGNDVIYLSSSNYNKCRELLAKTMEDES